MHTILLPLFACDSTQLQSHFAQSALKFIMLHNHLSSFHFSHFPQTSPPDASTSFFAPPIHPFPFGARSALKFFATFFTHIQHSTFSVQCSVLSVQCSVFSAQYSAKMATGARATLHLTGLVRWDPGRVINIRNIVKNITILHSEHTNVSCHFPLSLTLPFSALLIHFYCVRGRGPYAVAFFMAAPKEVSASSIWCRPLAEVWANLEGVCPFLQESFIDFKYTEIELHMNDFYLKIFYPLKDVTLITNVN